jgi:hypothetical protein
LLVLRADLGRQARFDPSDRGMSKRGSPTSCARRLLGRDPCFAVVWLFLAAVCCGDPPRVELVECTHDVADAWAPAPRDAAGAIQPPPAPDAGGCGLDAAVGDAGGPALDTGADCGTGLFFATGCSCEVAPRVTAEPPVPAFGADLCGMGLVLDGLEVTSGCWEGVYECHPGEAFQISVESADGCRGEGLALRYSLPATSDADWASLRRVLPEPWDLSSFDYLLLPFKAEAETTAAARTIEFKLEDADGCRTTALLTRATDLPVLRTAVFSLEMFERPGFSTCAGEMMTDLTRISAWEIGVSEVGDDVSRKDEAALGTLVFDDITLLTADELRRPVDSYERMEPDACTMEAIAASIRSRQLAHGLVPTWYEEPEPLFHVYAEALALVVQSFEAARTGDAAAVDAATALAEQLVELQEEGTWVNVYAQDGEGVVPATSEVYEGNVSWAVIALSVFLDDVRPQESAKYESAIEAAHAWLTGRIAEYSAETGRSGGISDGTEANVSTYFALVSAGDTAAAKGVAQFLLRHAWDKRRGHFRMGVTYPGLALDVMGGWGVELLRHIGDDDLAFGSLGLAAGIFPVESWDASSIGLGDIAGPWQPTAEFTAQYAAAGGPGAAWLVQQLDALQVRPGEFRGAPSDYAGGDGWNTSWTGLPSSANVYIALRGGFLSEL